jgi:hypothetical protein
MYAHHGTPASGKKSDFSRKRKEKKKEILASIFQKILA